MGLTVKRPWWLPSPCRAPAGTPSPIHPDDIAMVWLEPGPQAPSTLSVWIAAPLPLRLCTISR
jgi:hypothetical protein